MILLGVVTLITAACGGGSSSTSASEQSQSSGGNRPVALSGTTNNMGTETASGSELNVELDDFYFKPTFIKGTPGQMLTLHLENEGKNAHTFTSAALNVDETLQAGEKTDVQVTLPQSGATEYHCSFHQSSGMQGAFFFNAGDTVAGSGAGSGNTSSSPSVGNYDNN
jgi:plastocyanin